MQFWHLLIAAVLLGVMSSSQATDFDIALSAETASFELTADSGSVGAGGADLLLGLFFNEDSDVMGSLGMLAYGVPAGEQPFTFGLGGKLYYASIDQPNSDVSALALGGTTQYHIPGNMPMILGAELYFAPGITSFQDADQLLDLRLRFSIDILPSAAAFIGYRLTAVDFVEGRDEKEDDHDLDENIHLGIRIQF